MHRDAFSHRWMCGTEAGKKRGGGKGLKGSNVMEISLVLDYRGDNAYIGIAWDGIELH